MFDVKVRSQRMSGPPLKLARIALDVLKGWTAPWSDDVIAAHCRFDFAIGACSRSMRSHRMSGPPFKLARIALNVLKCGQPPALS